MNKKSVGRYSKYIRPLTYVLDLFIINLFANFLLVKYYSLYFSIFISLSWIIIAINVNFYEVYRFTKILSILNKTIKQSLLFTIVCYSFSGFYIKNPISNEIFIYLFISLVTILFFKLLIYISLKKYRLYFGGNFRRIVIIGNGKNVDQLTELFNNNLEFGCKLIKTFSFDNNKNEIINEALNFVLENNIDVIYCSLFQLSKKELDVFIDFSENNLLQIKFLPSKEDIITDNYKVDYYGYIPVLTIQKTSLHDPITKIIKRIFDILFSLLVIIGVLSWLIPIMALLIKIESKGPVFFKQGRPGYNEEEFFCYKFRSMRINNTTEKEASKGDPRVTKTGRFIRKTSMDELPQFLNVLKGEMSVVGPRPHLWSQNKAYGNRIKKYMVRHYVKPGITGLAQVKGYRGEIESDDDMINRINYDVFYIENWSLLLDIKIIVQTVINIFKGEEKAY